MDRTPWPERMIPSPTPGGNCVYGAARSDEAWDRMVSFMNELSGDPLGREQMQKSASRPGRVSLVRKALCKGLTEQGARVSVNSPGAVQQALAASNPKYRRVTFGFDGPTGTDPGDAGLVTVASDAMVSGHLGDNWECLPGHEEELAAALDDLRDQFFMQNGRQPNADDKDFQSAAAQLMLAFSATRYLEG